jgi:hypothetical protein
MSGTTGFACIWAQTDRLPRSETLEPFEFTEGGGVHADSEL